MRIAVCLEQVVTREWPVRIDERKSWIRDADASWELNEPDAYALEAALVLREAAGAEVIALSAGPPRVTQVLREALARGADRAIHVSGTHLSSPDPTVTAGALADAIRPLAADLVLTGLQSDDFGFGSVGVIVAEKLGVAHSTLTMAIEIGDGTVRVKRELEGGWFQWVTLPTPAVLTIQSGINQLRYATLKGIMAAKRKPIDVVDAGTPSAGPKLRIVSMSLPTRTRAIRLFSGSPVEAARALASALRDDARL